MKARRRSYLIQDPYADDAIDFIRSIQVSFGLRPVCLHTDPNWRFFVDHQNPELAGDLVEEHVEIFGRDLAEVCEELNERYDIAGVVPFREDTIELAAELTHHLKLGWNDRDTLRRFRDKTELKRHVVEVDPSVRVPKYLAVHSVDDVWSEPDLPQRFVIKPNDGVGNQRIGIFNIEERDAIAAHVESEPPTEWILEEYIGGNEYHVNGQVRSNGEVTVIAIFLYTRTTSNGYETVYSGEQQCHTTDPHFDEIVAYTKELMTATGLRRCPFHLEVKVDELGPCLIDLGARYGSDGAARTFSRLHPGRPDAFAVAAHDYLGENDFAMDPVDFTFHDTERTAIAFGISESDGMILSLHGMETIEAMPEFVNWLIKPKVGDRLAATKELHSAPYIVEMRHGGSKEDSDRLIDFVHETIRWNEDESPVLSARVHAKKLAERARTKLRWIVS